MKEQTKEWRKKLMDERKNERINERTKGQMGERINE